MKSLLSLLSLVACSCIWLEGFTLNLHAKPTKDNVAQHIDLSQFPAASVDNVIIPLPSEIFQVLDGLGNPKWKDFLLLGEKIRTPNNRPKIALLLGSVIAEGFIAIEAEDTEDVKRLGKEVLTLAEAIGVRNSVIARSKSIIEKADHHNWRGVRSEFDGAQYDVRTAMTEMDDDDLAQLVSLGGWLRGTDVLTAIITLHHNRSAIDLLHQPQIVTYFQHTLKKMPRRLRKGHNLIPKTITLLNKLAPIVTSNPSTITMEKIGVLHDLTHELILNIDEIE